VNATREGVIQGILVEVDVVPPPVKPLGDYPVGVVYGKYHARVDDAPEVVEVKVAAASDSVSIRPATRQPARGKP
jgi:hypothetical protein